MSEKKAVEKHLDGSSEKKIYFKGKRYQGKLIPREAIVSAMLNTKSNRSAANYLHVAYNTYKRYAKLYCDENGVSLWDKHLNQSGRDIPKMTASMVDRALSSVSKGQRPTIVDILEGRVSPNHYSVQKLKAKLIAMGYLTARCKICGFAEKRQLDGKSPLILNFKDRNKNNWKLDNLEFLCYNCAFLHRPKLGIDDEMVEKEESWLDLQEKNGMDYQITDYQRKFLENLMKDQMNPAEEFVARAHKTGKKFDKKNEKSAEIFD